MKKTEFIELANSILIRLEKRLNCEQLKEDYLYNAIHRLIEEVKNETFTSSKTDIGVAAVKTFDSNSSEDNELIRDISNLGQAYKKIQKYKL